MIILPEIIHKTDQYFLQVDLKSFGITKGCKVLSNRFKCVYAHSLTDKYRNVYNLSQIGNSIHINHTSVIHCIKAHECDILYKDYSGLFDDYLNYMNDAKIVIESLEPELPQIERFFESIKRNLSKPWPEKVSDCEIEKVLEKVSEK